MQSAVNEARQTLLLPLSATTEDGRAPSPPRTPFTASSERQYSFYSDDELEELESEGGLRLRETDNEDDEDEDDEMRLSLPLDEESQRRDQKQVNPQRQVSPREQNAHTREPSPLARPTLLPSASFAATVAAARTVSAAADSSFSAAAQSFSLLAIVHGITSDSQRIELARAGRQSDGDPANTLTFHSSHSGQIVLRCSTLSILELRLLDGKGRPIAYAMVAVHSTRPGAHVVSLKPVSPTQTVQYQPFTCEVLVSVSHSSSVPEGIAFQDPPLVAAVRSRDAGTVAVLVTEKNVRLDVCDSNGRTAMHHAILQQNREAGRLLLHPGKKHMPEARRMLTKRDFLGLSPLTLALAFSGASVTALTVLHQCWTEGLCGALPRDRVGNSMWHLLCYSCPPWPSPRDGSLITDKARNRLVGYVATLGKVAAMVSGGREGDCRGSLSAPHLSPNQANISPVEMAAACGNPVALLFFMGELGTRTTAARVEELEDIFKRDGWRGLGIDYGDRLVEEARLGRRRAEHAGNKVGVDGMPEGIGCTTTTSCNTARRDLVHTILRVAPLSEDLSLSSSKGGERGGRRSSASAAQGDDSVVVGMPRAPRRITNSERESSQVWARIKRDCWGGRDEQIDTILEIACNQSM